MYYHVQDFDMSALINYNARDYKYTCLQIIGRLTVCDDIQDLMYADVKAMFSLPILSVASPASGQSLPASLNRHLNVSGDLRHTLL